MKRATVQMSDAPDAGLRDEVEDLGLVGAETSRAALEPQPDSPSGRRTLGAASAGRSGHHDVSERVQEILADAAAGAARRDATVVAAVLQPGHQAAATSRA